MFSGWKDSGCGEGCVSVWRRGTDFEKGLMKRSNGVRKVFLGLEVR